MSLLKSIVGELWRTWWLVGNILEYQETISVLQASQFADKCTDSGLLFPCILCLACLDGLEGLSSVQNTSETDLETQLWSCLEGEQLEGACAQCCSLELQEASHGPQKMISFALKLRVEHEILIFFHNTRNHHIKLTCLALIKTFPANNLVFFFLSLEWHPYWIGGVALSFVYPCGALWKHECITYHKDFNLKARTQTPNWSS